MADLRACSMCKAPDGRVGCFLRDAETRELHSPVFADSYELFQWMRVNGFRLHQYSDDGREFVPSRVVPVERVTDDD